MNRHKNVAMTTSLSPMEERLQQAPDNKCTDMYNLNSSGESGPAEVFIKSGNRCTDMYNLNSSGESGPAEVVIKLAVITTYSIIIYRYC